ncbi:nucleoside phosphorylase domain-containing protein [Fusarium flagelliforme]|uniref:nucleoside phosphorylase domain-containing protein n=1 Tax=Fusarium flagelliforme TaxID=2675880 RepID=UPI001E8EA5A0|nr:nucleoside phosphorylase domain-containing protein [Fusarium flagelliforme]KAH7186008.1 nucleoside phosphorylase domain-containing protein [Fusarium flagelliforme]
MSIPPGTQLSDFRIGWVCIVEKEYYAALDVLDERWSLDHNSSLEPGSNATSGYELGNIRGHNVVINIPHQVKGGLLHAQEITSQMKINFPYIRFILLVGIGGGAPALAKDDDIRLGDVVFGDFVIPYKKGKELDDGFEIDPERLKPPQQLLTAVTELRYRLRNDPVDRIFEEIANNSDSNKEVYRRPAADRLLKSSITHQDDVCECLQPGLGESLGLVARKARPSTNYIQTHRGVVGSADQVLKNVQERDRLSREKNILCFEMEAAAVMRSTKCITIRGIADYADGHKNDDWHSYAALAAAVCAKKLLIVLRPETVRGIKIDLGLFEFALRFQGVTARINTNLGSKERNAQDAFNKTEEAIDLHEDQTKLFTDFTNAHKGKDQEMKIMLKSSHEVLQQQLEMLQEQVKRQRKENKSSDYVTREDWNSLKERVEERKQDVNYATEALGKVGDLLGIAGGHTGNKHLGFAKQYVDWAGRVIDWLLLLKRNSSQAPSTALSDGVSHSSRSSTPRSSLTVSKASQGEFLTPNKPRKRDMWKRFFPGERRDQPDPEPLNPSPDTLSGEGIADRTQVQPSLETARSSPNTPADERRLDKTQDESDLETPSPLLGAPSDRSDGVDQSDGVESDGVDQSDGVPVPPTHSPPPIPSNRRRRPPPPPPPETTSPGGAKRPPPNPRPSAQRTPIEGSSSSNHRTESQGSNNLEVSQDTYEDQDSRLPFNEKMKRFQSAHNKDR